MDIVLDTDPLIESCLHSHELKPDLISSALHSILHKMSQKLLDTHHCDIRRLLVTIPDMCEDENKTGEEE
jgi:hypothetical protein